MSRSRLVYDTDVGRVCPVCARPVAACVCPKGSRRPSAAAAGDPRDGVVRVQRETKGRAGKMATTIRGVPLAAADLDALAGELKRRLGTGGGVHDGVIVIQGDHAEILLGLLREKGYTVKRAGG